MTSQDIPGCAEIVSFYFGFRIRNDIENILHTILAILRYESCLFSPGMIQRVSSVLPSNWHVNIKQGTRCQLLRKAL